VTLSFQLHLGGVKLNNVCYAIYVVEKSSNSKVITEHPPVAPFGPVVVGKSACMYLLTCQFLRNFVCDKQCM